MPLSERGFSLISAIFLLVVIAALGTFAVTLSTTQQQSAALDALGSRAYQAARAGIEWGAIQITHSGVAGVDKWFATQCQNSSSLHVTASQPVLPTGTQLSVFSVGVTCGATSAVGDTLNWVYELTSTASGIEGASPGSPDYVERQIRVTIAQ
ncbi:MAG: pilus assembly PilX N-terminal domain-containing protein [Gallionella sp.]|nr:pilus assembly PilX N-terminal domain-containing protein [Gallionella sp.]